MDDIFNYSKIILDLNKYRIFTAKNARNWHSNAKNWHLEASDDQNFLVFINCAHNLSLSNFFSRLLILENKYLFVRGGQPTHQPSKKRISHLCLIIFLFF